MCKYLKWNSQTQIGMTAHTLLRHSTLHWSRLGSSAISIHVLVPFLVGFARTRSHFTMTWSLVLVWWQYTLKTLVLQDYNMYIWTFEMLWMSVCTNGGNFRCTTQGKCSLIKTLTLRFSFSKWRWGVGYDQVLCVKIGSHLVMYFWRH